MSNRRNHRRQPASHSEPTRHSVRHYSRRKHAIITTLLFVKMVFGVLLIHLVEGALREPEMMAFGFILAAAIAVVAPAIGLEGMIE